MKKALTLATLFLLGSAQAAWAHPGHGFAGTVESALHWLMSIDHAVTVMAVIVVAGVAAALRRALRSTS